MRSAALVALGALALSSLAACTAELEGTDAAENDATKTTYVDALDFWKTPEDQASWLELRRTLKREFDEVCGDTFCSGDYSNLESIGFTCGVTRVKGQIKECVWDFTGSSHLVNGATGTVQASIASFQCRFAPKATTLATLRKRLLEPGPTPAIRRTIPGAAQTLYDVLGDCFQKPIGATALVFASASTYVDALDAQGTDQDKWIDATRALRADFDRVCPDTFCSGDYSNVQALRFVCSLRDTTNTIRDCKWLLGGSFSTVDAKTGSVAITPKAWRCTVPAKGKANDLATMLTAPGDTKPIDRTLPGSTKSAYGVLLDCL